MSKLTKPLLIAYIDKEVEASARMGERFFDDAAQAKLMRADWQRMKKGIEKGNATKVVYTYLMTNKFIPAMTFETFADIITKGE